MIQVAVIGFGFMGMTHARQILRNPKLKLQAIITRNTSGVEEKLSGQSGNFSSGDTNADLHPAKYRVAEYPPQSSLQTLQLCYRHI